MLELRAKKAYAPDGVDGGKRTGGSTSEWGTRLVNPMSKEVSHLPRSISATWKGRSAKKTPSKQDVSQKRQATRLVNTMSKEVSHLPRSISAMWKARSAKKVHSLVRNKSKSKEGCLSEETDHQARERKSTYR